MRWRPAPDPSGGLPGGGARTDDFRPERVEESGILQTEGEPLLLTDTDGEVQQRSFRGI